MPKTRFLLNPHSLSLLAAAALLPLGARAATLSLSAAVSEALDNSPRIQRVESAAREAHWKKVGSFSGFLPSVNLTGSHLLDKKYMYIDVALGGAAPISFPSIVPDTIFTLEGRLPVFDGFANVNRYRAASSFEDAADQQLEWEKFQLERNVVLLYYKAVGAKALQQVAEQNVRTLQDHLKEVNLLKRAGVSTNYDVLRVEVQVSEAQSEVLNAADNLELARNQLAQAMGKATEARDLSSELPVLQENMISSVKGVDAGERADMVALAAQVEGTEHLESAAATHLVPALSLFGQYQYYNNRNTDVFSSGGYRDAHAYGVVLSWNLFDGMASIARSKESVEASYQAEKRLEEARVRTVQDFDLWRRKFLYFCSVYDARVNDVEKAKESVRLAREGRKAGARTNTDILDAEGDLYRAQAGVVHSQLGAIESMLNLEQAVGKPIHRFF
jgi:outer membrane protein TolC